MTKKLKIPKHWKYISLVEDLNYVSTGVEPYEGEKPYYSTGCIKDKEYTPEGKYTFSDRPSRANRLVQKNDILQARMKGTNKALLVDNRLDGALFSTGFFQVRSYGGTYVPKFLYFYLGSNIFLKEKDALCSGSTQSALNDTNAKKIKIPLPPIEEQSRIVAKIESLFSKLDKSIESFQTAKKKLTLYRQSVLKAAFEGELTKAWREAHKDELEDTDTLLERIKKEREEAYEKRLDEWKAAVKVWEKSGKEGKKPAKPRGNSIVAPLNIEELKKLPFIPLRWSWIHLGEIFNVYVGATPSRKNPNYWNGNISWVSSGEVAFSNILNTKEKITEAGLKNTSTELHPPGTIMLGMIGEGKTRGQAAILRIHAAHNQNTAAIRLDDTNFPSEYLYYFLMYTYEKTRKLGSGNNQKALNKSRVESIDFPLCDEKEQRKIIQQIELHFSEIDGMEKTIDMRLKNAEQLRQSILKDAFEGRLIARDPNDEPVSELLNRIQKQKEEYELEQKRKKNNRRRNKVTKKLSLVEALQESKDYRIKAKELWQRSKYQDDIEDFYAALKQSIEVDKTIIEMKNTDNNESYLRLANED